MVRVHTSILGLALMAVSASAATDMGPAAFMWPPDRVWSADADNKAPCGSTAGPGNRTDFPLKNGMVAIVDQDEGYDVQLSISRQADPQSNNDFSVLISPSDFKELDKGHTCVPVQAPPSFVKAGDKATLQIKYISQFDKPENETFYACSDIVYIDGTSSTMQSMCFNATEPDDGSSSQQPGSSQTPSATPSSSPVTGGKKGLSGGAIAGIVIGVVAGVGLIAGAAFIIYRRKQQRLTNLRQQHSARGVKWNEQSGRDSASNPSVRMQNL